MRVKGLCADLVVLTLILHSCILIRCSCKLTSSSYIASCTICAERHSVDRIVYWTLKDSANVSIDIEFKEVQYNYLVRGFK